jgi:hypothetical protein
VSLSGDLPSKPPPPPWQRRAIALAPIALGVGFLAQRTLSEVLDKVGHPGATLDDAYIHFQYARALAEGHPMRFQAGEPITSGATSLLWPALLAPFWLVGFRGEAILWPAWALSYAALGALAWEAYELTKRLAGRSAAVGAGAMVLAFGGFAWNAASGMEVLPFAWAIARASRKASEWAESHRASRTLRQAGELVALAWVTALFRPEGAVTALFVAATLGAFPLPGSGEAAPSAQTAWRGVLRERGLALAAALAAFALPLLLLALTGSARSNTAVAKLLPGNPYYVGAELSAKILDQMRFLVIGSAHDPKGGILNGGGFSVEFLPHGSAYFAMAGLGAIATLGWQTRSRWRAAAVLLIALTMFAPCFYYTFLWNRLRYLWPFATGFLIGQACLARMLGEIAGWVHPRSRMVTPVLCGVVTGMLASKLEWVIDDVAQSASGIDRQQVTLGRWAHDSLAEGVRIGVNDTGAIAYFSGRKTFDVVGLTTEGEARYWVAGVGSRLEHYERLRETAPAKLPTHFIVYPEWMGMPSVLGEPLHEETVTDSSILGGHTMRAYVADWSLLGTGEKPWTAAPGDLLDVLDVADLESEAAHRYELLGAHENEEVARQAPPPDGGPEVVDGGRTRRYREKFVVRLRRGAPARSIVRLEAPEGTRVSVSIQGRLVARFDAGNGESWLEREFDIPADLAGENTEVEVRFAGGLGTVFHYWFFTPLG